MHKLCIVHVIYNVKAKSQAGNRYGQRYNDNTKRPKSQHTQLWILKMYAFCCKIQQRASGSGESTAGGYISVYGNTPKELLHLPPKSCCNITEWFKEGCSWSLVVT